MRRFLADRALGSPYAGAIHEHVQSAELLQRQRHRRFAIGLGGNVGLGEAPAKLARELLACFHLHVDDDHLAAVLGGHARRGRTQARSTARDKENAVLDLQDSSPEE